MLLEIKEKTEKRKRIKQRPLNAALRDKFTSGQRRGQAGWREGAEVRHDSNISMRHAIVCVSVCVLHVRRENIAEEKENAKLKLQVLDMQIPCKLLLTIWLSLRVSLVIKRILNNADKA